MATFKEGLTALVKQISNIDLTTEHAAVAAALLDVTGAVTEVDAIPNVTVSAATCKIKFDNDSNHVFRVNAVENAVGAGFKIYGSDTATMALSGAVPANTVFNAIYYLQPVDGSTLSNFTISSMTSEGGLGTITDTITNGWIEVEIEGMIAGEILSIRIQD